MCGRYAAFLPPEAIVALFQIRGAVPNWPPTWNMAPTRDAPVVRLHPDTRERRLDLLRWGLLPHWAKDPKTTRQPINARAETLAQSSMFRDALARRRCLVPADAFYEWKVTEGVDQPDVEAPPMLALTVADGMGSDMAAAQGRHVSGRRAAGKPAATVKQPIVKQPWAIAREDGQPIVFAGLWEGWRGPDGAVIRSYTIVTTEANATLRPLHERMPVVLEPEDWPLWLGETEGDPASLLRPSLAEFRTWRVGPAVNNVRNDSPALLEAA